MTQPSFQVVPAAYLVLSRERDGAAQVLLQRRRGTAYMDGWWACAAAGHVERGESVLQAGVREAAEELGITVSAEELQALATVHRTCALADPIEQRVDFFFRLLHWEGEPHVAEPHKSAELRWFPLTALPESVVPHERRVLDALAAGTTPTLLVHGFDQHLTLVAAVGSNGVIGDGTGLPWHLPEDLAHFKRTTLGGVLLMGRTTWEAIGRALPGRRTVVLTRDRTWSAPGAQVAHSLAEALLVAGDQEVFVVGGGEVYAQTIDHASRLLVTEVDQAPEGSARFPVIDETVWEEVAREPRDGYAFVTWQRRGEGGQAAS